MQILLHCMCPPSAASTADLHPMSISTRFIEVDADVTMPSFMIHDRLQVEQTIAGDFMMLSFQDICICDCKFSFRHEMHLICLYPYVIKIGTPKTSLNLGQKSRSSGKLLAVLAEAVS